MRVLKLNLDLTIWFSITQTNFFLIFFLYYSIFYIYKIKILTARHANVGWGAGFNDQHTASAQVRYQAAAVSEVGDLQNREGKNSDRKFFVAAASGFGAEMRDFSELDGGTGSPSIAASAVASGWSPPDVIQSRCVL